MYFKRFFFFIEGFSITISKELAGVMAMLNYYRKKKNTVKVNFSSNLF